MYPIQAVSPTRTRRALGLSGWTEDLVRAFRPDDFAKLSSGVSESLESVAKAFEGLGSFTEGMDTLDSMRGEALREFGPPATMGFPPIPNWPSMIAFSPLLVAQANLRVEGRRLVAVDVLFLELALSFTNMGNAFGRAGLGAEANQVRLASKAMRDWRADFEIRGYNRMPALRDDRAVLEADFERKLSSKGLRRITDDDKAGYFEALRDSVADYAEDPSPDEAAGLQGTRRGLGDAGITAAILALVKVVVIVAGIVAIAVLVSRVVQNIFGAANEAMSAARELQRRKTVRQETLAAEIESNELAVQNGEMTREEADARNERAREEVSRADDEDSRSFKAEVDAAAEAAAKATPGISVGSLLLYVGIPAVGITLTAAALKALKVF